MPNGVERALADAFYLGETADVPWSMPANLPAAKDLRLALEILEPQPATREHIAFCFARMMAGLEPTTKMNIADEKLRISVWFDACADLGNELWTIATREALLTCKWMPKPAEFRALVSDKLGDRSRKITRCRAMLDRVEAQNGVAAQFVEDTPEVKARTLRDSYRKIGRLEKAQQYERELAKLEGREAESWVNDPVPAGAKDELPSLPKRPPNPEREAASLRVQARFFRAQENERYAAYLERQADALWPMEGNEEPAALGGGYREEAV